jgi:hypothetical protein
LLGGRIIHLRERENFIGVKRFSQGFLGQGLQGDRGGHLLSGLAHIFNILQRLRYRSERVVQGDVGSHTTAQRLTICHFLTRSGL